MISKYLFNNVAPLLLRMRWKKINFSLFENRNLQLKLDKGLPNITLNTPKKYKILIGSIRSQANSNLFEGGVGMAFSKAGIETSVLRCGQFLKSCETKSHFKDDQMSCSMCHIEFDYFLKTFNLPAISYSELISRDLKEEINKFVDTCDLTEFRYYKGYDLQNEWYCALQRYYLSTEKYLVEKEKIAKQFLFTVISSFEAGRILVNKENFTHLFTSHGIYSTWGSLVAGFRAAGGDVTVWGRGYYESGIVSFKNESYLNGLKHYDYEYVKERLNPKYLNIVESYLDSKWSLTNNSDTIKYYHNKNHNDNSDIDINEGINYIGFFPNIPWDGQAFVSTENYRSLNDVVETLIKYVDSHKNTHIIIRPHPAENPLRNPNIGETFLDIADKYKLQEHHSFTIIPYDSPITSYDVAEKVKVNVLFAGTIGVELAAKGLNVIQLGRNVSSNKEIFFEPASYVEFESTLDEILEEKYPKVNPEVRQKALEWAAFYYCQAHVQDPFFNYKGYRMVDVKDSMSTDRIDSYLTWVLNGKGLYHI